MKKTGLVICLILCVCLLASCSSIPFESVAKDVAFKDTYQTPNEMNKVPGLNGATVMDTNDELMSLTDGSKYIVYNITKNEIVWSGTSGSVASLSLFDVYGTEFFRVDNYHNDGKFSASVYDKNGDLIAESGRQASSVNNIDSSFDLFKFDNTVYRVSLNGRVETVLKKNPLQKTLPDFDFAIGGYYYEISNELVLVYDSNLSLVSSWKPGYDTDYQQFTVLNNGNILVQLVEELPEYVEEYTVIANDKKCLITSYIVNHKNGEAKEVELDYYLLYSLGKDMLQEDGALDESFDSITNVAENYAVVFNIADKRLPSYPSFISIDNSGNIKGELFEDIEFINTSKGLPEIVSDGVFSYEDISGNTRIVDAKGKLIMEIPKSLYVMKNVNYIAAGGSLYDYNGNQVFNYEQKGYQVHTMLAHSVIFSDEQYNYYLYLDGAQKKIIESGSVSAIAYTREMGVVYAINNGESYDYYNDLGEKLATVDTLITNNHTTDSGIIILYGMGTFYRLER